MARAELTVVVPTRDRPGLVGEAVDSAVAQTEPVEVIVVDDGSDPPARLASHPRVATVRHEAPAGVSAARNRGLAQVETPYVAFLDDDDRLRADFAQRSLAALADADAPPPVAALSGVAVVDERGVVEQVRLPPPRRDRGAHFSLEPLQPGCSYFTKQTLVVPVDVLRSVGGFDETFASRVVTELFWRLNPVCSLVGLPRVTYELRRHAGARLSTDPTLRLASFDQLVAAHADLLAAHPEGYADLLAQHARNCLAARRPLPAARAVARHARVAPRLTRRRAAARVRDRR